jgi:hypothetical protein
MASGKKKRKAANLTRKGRLPQGVPFRHRDGDRRHRAAMAAAVKALKQRQALEQQLGGAVPPEPQEEE